MKLNDPDWEDMSDYVVHFTKLSPEKTAYENMLSILWTRTIEARNRFGIARKDASAPASQEVVCFSEIPLHMLKRLADKRGKYGIGFTKKWLVERGGGPILYAYKGTPHWAAFDKLIKRAKKAPNPESEPIWQTTPFIDSPGEYGFKNYFFE